MKPIFKNIFLALGGIALVASVVLVEWRLVDISEPLSCTVLNVDRSFGRRVVGFDAQCDGRKVRVESGLFAGKSVSGRVLLRNGQYRHSSPAENYGASLCTTIGLVAVLQFLRRRQANEQR